MTAIGRYIPNSELSKDKEKIAKSLVFYSKLHGILHITRNVFDIQRKRRDLLWENLRVKIPEQIKKYEFKNNGNKILFEKGFEEMYSFLDETDLELFNYIRFLTDDMMKYNSNMHDLLYDNYEYFIDIPELGRLHRHLIAWIAKFKNKMVKPNICLIYVGVEDGAPFPKEMEGIIEEKLK